jgi:acetyl esterase
MSLHPQVKRMLDQLYEVGWQDVPLLTVAEARQQYDFYAGLRQFPQDLPPIGTEDFELRRASHQGVLLRTYYPPILTRNAVIIYYHGGGYVLSSLQHYDALCRWICSEMGMPVIAVDYRLAPENPFPDPIEDGYAALEWVTEQFSNKERIVAGDSAGAHLAAMVSILSRDRKGPEISRQWLIYPWVDQNTVHASYKIYGEGYLLTTAGIQWYTRHFLSRGNNADFPAFPLQVENLSNLPPTCIIAAECDPLHDEAYVFSEKLQEAGNKVYCDYAPGMVHGFINQYAIPACFNAAKNVFLKFKNGL